MQTPLRLARSTARALGLSLPLVLSVLALPATSWAQGGCEQLLLEADAESQRRWLDCDRSAAVRGFDLAAPALDVIVSGAAEFLTARAEAEIEAFAGELVHRELCTERSDVHILFPAACESLGAVVHASGTTRSGSARMETIVAALRDDLVHAPGNLMRVLAAQAEHGGDHRTRVLLIAVAEILDTARARIDPPDLAERLFITAQDIRCPDTQGECAMIRNLLMRGANVMTFVLRQSLHGEPQRARLAFVAGIEVLPADALNRLQRTRANIEHLTDALSRPDLSSELRTEHATQLLHEILVLTLECMRLVIPRDAPGLGLITAISDAEGLVEQIAAVTRAASTGRIRELVVSALRLIARVLEGASSAPGPLSTRAQSFLREHCGHEDGGPRRPIVALTTDPTITEPTRHELAFEQTDLDAARRFEPLSALATRIDAEQWGVDSERLAARVAARIRGLRTIPEQPVDIVWLVPAAARERLSDLEVLSADRASWTVACASLSPEGPLASGLDALTLELARAEGDDLADSASERDVREDLAEQLRARAGCSGAVSCGLVDELSRWLSSAADPDQLGLGPGGKDYRSVDRGTAGALSRLLRALVSQPRTREALWAAREDRDALLGLLASERGSGELLTDWGCSSAATCPVLDDLTRWLAAAPDSAALHVGPVGTELERLDRELDGRLYALLRARLDEATSREALWAARGDGGEILRVVVASSWAAQRLLSVRGSLTDGMSHEALVRALYELRVDPRIVQLFGLAAALATAETEEDVREILEDWAAPVGSWREKYRRSGVWSITGLVGIGTGTDVLTAPDSPAAPFVALHASIGLDVTLWLTDACFFGALYLGIIDLGGWASAPFDIGGDTQAAAELDPLSALSPGLYLRLGLGPSPITLGFGASYVPRARRIDRPEPQADTTSDAIRLSAFLAIDTTLWVL